jgi:transcriptional regulator with XRE-family HTH domain
MADFATVVRQFMTERGMSLRGLARAMHCDPSYLSKILNGHKPVSPHLAALADDILNAEGEIRQAAVSAPQHRSTPRRGGSATTVGCRATR